jgi:AcrR family transcriptional regulator
MSVIKEEIRDKIIDSASKIFSRFGFKKTTMDEIAQSMHKGKSSIYYYFKSKEEIFEAVIDKEVTAFKIEVTLKLAPITSPKEKLRAYITTRMHALKRMSNFYEAIRNEYLSHLDFINKIRVKYDENEVITISQFLKSGIETGEFQLDDPQLAAMAIVTTMRGLEIPLFWSGEQQDIEKRIDSLLSLLFYGIVKK